MKLESGASPNETYSSGWTPLTFAAFTNRPEIIKLLLEYGADPNMRDRYGCIARSGALARDRKEIVRLIDEFKR